MKIQIIYLSTLLVTVFLIASCSNDQEREETGLEAGKTEIDEAADLSLNNGDKWLANAETTDGIKAMQLIVSEYETQTKTPATEMGTELQHELDQIFQQCNMKGEAHEQLHHYLMPLIEKVNAIKDQEVEEQQFRELQSYLELYFKYFK